METETKRANIQELIDLLIVRGQDIASRWWEWPTCEAYGTGFPAIAYNGYMDTRTAAGLHIAAGLMGPTYDTALPQPWFNAFCDATGETPCDIVWAYGDGVFGGPYALTGAAQHALDAFRAAGGRP